MKRILIGLIVAAVLAAGGWLGFNLYAKHRATAEIEAGALEFSLHDNGGVDLVVTQFARMQNVSRDAARQSLVESIKAKREQIASANPEADAAVDAVARFIETPGQTLSIKLSPRAKAPLMQMMQLLQADPQSALAQFRIEASTGL